MSDPALYIRPALISDLERIGELWQQLFDLHARIDPIFTPAPDGRDHYRRWLRHLLEEEENLILVAEWEGHVEGYGLAQVQTLPPVVRYRRIGCVLDLSVDERRRRQGIGRALYAELERRLKERGVRRIELKTSTFNPAANAFWEKACGFREFVKIRCKPVDD